MKSIVFFDTETTGSGSEDYLCQIAWMKKGAEMRSGLFKPPLPIPAEASAIHHISNKMVADKPAFKGSTEWEEIKELFEDDETVVVAHNAKFDLAMLEKEGIVPKHFICTLRVARAMDPESKLSNYQLQYLRYALDLVVDESALAHSADGDVLVLEQLFERLIKKISDKKNTDEALKEMTQISELPSLLKTVPFGKKHKGKTFEEVAIEDKGWLEWLLREKMKESSKDDDDLVYTLKFHLGKLM